jgi:hypothetical protein
MHQHHRSAVTAREVIGLVPSMAVRAILRWWHERAERHYLMCADVEQQHAREAQMNVAHYQKQAAIARSNKWTQQ